MTIDQPVKVSFANLTDEELLRSAVSVLNGVTVEAEQALHGLGIHSVFDLAMSRVFANAYRLATLVAGRLRPYRYGMLPSDVGHPDLQSIEDPTNWPLQDIELLDGIGPSNAPALRTGLGVRMIADLAYWPPFIAARGLAGLTPDGDADQADPGVPAELVPKFNEHATEKAYYSVYVIDPLPYLDLPELEEAIDLAQYLSHSGSRKPRRGKILRYEHSWTPLGLTLGNLLHSVALAPGESTRIAIIDWARRQGVRTSEDISQLESLSNVLMQARTINEITRAVAREAQSGFSSINSNSTVSNNGYSSYGVQNAEETLSAGLAGATAGGQAGVVGGAIAGGGVGALVGTGVGAVGAGVGAVPGWAIGTVAGGAIGAGAGGLIGATAGGIGSALTVAEFGANSQSDSNVTLDTVTTTSSAGDREVEADMLQDIQERTQQHSSTSRNRRASIVQEVSQSETEKVTTRVVTNYNHMHALTIQYFEVVQLYSVRTTLVSRKHCLYVPILPIERWTSALVSVYRRWLVRAALSLDIVYSLLASAQTTVLHSPTYPLVPADQRRAFVSMLSTNGSPLLAARAALNAYVSGDPLDGWRVSSSYRIAFIFGIHLTGGVGPFGSGAGGAGYLLKWELAVYFRSGERHVVDLDSYGEVDLRLSKISRVNYEITNLSPADWSFEEQLPKPKYGSMTFLLQPEGAGHWEEDTEGLVRFSAVYAYSQQQVRDNKLIIPVLELAHAMAEASVLQHLNDNTLHYSSRILASRNNPLLPRILGQYAHNGQPLLNVVDQEPVAVSGNDLVFVLHDQSDTEARDERYELGSVSNSQVIPVGTGGVFAEAVQGRANSAEPMDLSRFWNWQDSPIPIVAPEIAPVQTGSRATSADVRPGSLDEAVVGYVTQNVLPVPQGLPATLSALSSDLFRDMSGIAQTAQLAQSSLEQATQGAIAAGGQASENLQQGLAFTKELLGKIIEMNSDYAQLLTKTGFQALSGGTTPTAKGGLNPSLGGSLMNKAKELDQKKQHAASGAQGAAPRGGGTGQSGSTGGGLSVTPGNAGVVSGSTVPGGQAGSLEEEVLRSWTGTQTGTPYQIPPVPTEQPGATSTDSAYVVMNRVNGELLLADFAIDSAELKSGHREALDALIDMVNQNSVHITSLYGRASQTGVESDNYQLSERRLIAVGNYLVDRGVGADQATPLGERDPLDVDGPLENMVDRSVQIFFTSDVPVPARGQEIREQNPSIGRSSNWSVRVKSGGGKSKSLKGSVFVSAYDIELRNDDTNELLPASITVIGPSLAASFVDRKRDWSEWRSFSTAEPVTNDEWQYSWVRINRAKADLYLVSADVMGLYFYKMQDAEALHIESSFGLSDDGSVGFKLEAAAHGQVFLDKFAD